MEDNNEPAIGVKVELMLNVARYCSSDETLAQLREYLKINNCEEVIINKEFVVLIKKFLLDGGHGEKSQDVKVAVECSCGLPKAY